MSIAFVVHGHFYQPPRENPWTDSLECEPSAAPFHDWNARIHSECYRANAFARIHDRTGRIQSIVNNYGRMSFNFGPTLARWIERADPRTHARLVAADGDHRLRLGAGGAVAQAYAHPILPLASPADRRTQVLWGLADFRRRFGHPAEGLWLPETAANVATLETLIDLGVMYTILAPEQVAAVRATASEDWTSVDRDTVDTGRPYRWMHPDGSGRFLTIAVFDGPLSRSVAFGDTTRDAATLVAAARAAGARSRVPGVRLVLCASDGELFGHHKKFADLNLAYTNYVEGPRSGIDPTNLGAFLRAHPATWEMALGEGSDGRGTSWSCPHGVGRWWRDCGCTMAPSGVEWNHKWRTPLRQALDGLQRAAGEFFQSAGADLLVDPWGARDAYGTVVDAPMAERDALLASFGTAALATGGAVARDRARLLLEMQRATLLMYASCGWYFDDIAGLETSLVLRLGAYAADLMKEAGGHPPLAEMLDLLAGAKSNYPSGETGADVFLRVASDRRTPAQTVAAVALSRAAVSESAPLDLVPAGFTVDILSQPPPVPAPAPAPAVGHMRATVERTGSSLTARFAARWDPGRGFRVFVDDVEIQVRDVGREDRHLLLPLLLPRLSEEGAPVLAARMALDLGQDVVGASPEEAPLHRAYARLLLRLLAAEAEPPAEIVSLALALLDAAGPAMAPGAVERSQFEEHVAELLETVPASSGWHILAARLGFASPAVPDQKPVEPIT